MIENDELIDERIRAAVRRGDDGDWNDVRRRVRRKRVPMAALLVLLAATLVAAPAVAFRVQLSDLWATAEPERNLYVSATVDCGEGTFTLEMDPDTGAVVRQGGRTLARATTTEQEIVCDGRLRSEKSTPDDAPNYTGPNRQTYERVTLECRTGAPLAIVINPIWYHGGGRPPFVFGSLLLVARRGTTQAYASAALRRDPTDGRNWSAAWWDADVCAPR